MDRIAKTAATAFVDYFNTTRRTATVSLSERYKLLLLWFFNDMKHNGQSLYEYGLLDEFTEGWKIDTELDDELEAVYAKTIKCLTDGTCNIRYMDGDCTPLPSTLWYTDSTADEFFKVLVSNDTDMIEDGFDMGNLTFSDAMEQNIWDEDSFIFITDTSDPFGVKTYMETEQEPLIQTE